MATYREIHGKAIKSLSTDPSDDYVAGQIWYNTTSSSFKTVLVSKAWASAAPINTARGYLAGITSTAGQTAGLIFGGNTANPGLTGATATEEYDGSGWTTGGNLSTGRVGGAGLGTQTAAVFAGGRTPPAGTPPNDKDATITEEYDGSSWTSGGALSTGRRYLSAAGTLTSGLAMAGTVGGAPGAGTAQSSTEEYDGSSWTGGGALNTARQSGAGTGASQTAAILFGGSNTPSNAKTETYDGSSWTAQADMNSGTNAQAGFGTSTSAVSAGGETYRTNVEDWNGSSWAVNPATIAVGNQAMVGGGSSTAGLVMGGWRPAPLGDTTQEYNVSTSVITAAAFSSGGNLPQDSRGGGSFGAQTAGVYVGGLQYPSDTKNRTDEYNGSTWTNVNNLPDNFFSGNSCGTLTAGFIFGSNQGYGTEEACYEYDGTNWTAGGSLPDIGPAYGSAGGGGTQTAAVACGGYGDPPPGISTVQEYNGASWTANPNSLPTGNYNQAGDGTATALWIAGGYLSNTATLEFDGTSFTTSGALTSSRPSACGAGYGPQTTAIVSGGDASGGLVSEQYNGSTWATAPRMSTARKYGLGASRSAGSLTGFIAGGATPPNPNTNATEEYNPETSAVNVKTLTQS